VKSVKIRGQSFSLYPTQCSPIPKTALNHMLEETQSLIKAVRENPKKYLSIKLHIF